MENMRKALKEHIQNNPACSEASIIQIAQSMPSVRLRNASKILAEWIASGKVSKTNDQHTWV